MKTYDFDRINRINKIFFYSVYAVNPVKENNKRDIQLKELVIIDYGTGNIASLKNSFAFLGIPVNVSSDRKVIRNAAKLVLPGVGAFKPARRKLGKQGLDELVSEKVRQGTPLLGICLGMQLLFTRSNEFGNCSGLNLIPGTVEAITGVRKIPHMGWNQLHFTKFDPVFKEIPEQSYFYFVHSFICKPDDLESVTAQCRYGRNFCAVVRKENIIGMQFHPEKSGGIGLRVLRNFSYQEKN
ncbi:MAG: imidazole glycerol phosphate synthase subunit HisH [bacterium]